MNKFRRMRRSGVPVHRGEKFAWSGDVGTAELSSFGRDIVCDRIYEDALDTGFFVRSDRTGVERLFTLVGADKGPDGEITCWRYDSEAGTRIVVFND